MAFLEGYLLLLLHTIMNLLLVLCSFSIHYTEFCGSGSPYMALNDEISSSGPIKIFILHGICCHNSIILNINKSPKYKKTCTRIRHLNTCFLALLSVVV